MELVGRVGAVGDNAAKVLAPTSFEGCLPMTCFRSRVPKRYHDSIALLPVSCDSILTIYRELVKLVNRLPFQKRLVVCLVFRGNKFRLDLGEVKTAGVVCLIGLGLSLGTLVLYRLYFRIIVPFLNKIRASKGDDAVLDNEYTLYLETSDSAVDDRMGNSNSKKTTPSVYYAPGYGVALGSRSPSLALSDDLESSTEENVRLRAHSIPRQKSPSPASDKDSAIGGVGGGSEMSQSMYSENSINRDSFYSIGTAESGFDDLGLLDELRASKLSGSLKENFSPGSLRERNLQMLYRAHHGHDPGLNNIGKSVKPGLDTVSDCSSEKSGVIYARSHRSSCGSSDSSQFIRTNVDPLVERLVGSNSSRTSSRHSQTSNDRWTNQGFSKVSSDHDGSFSAFMSPRNSCSPQRHVSSHSSSPISLTPTHSQLQSNSNSQLRPPHPHQNQHHHHHHLNNNNNQQQQRHPDWSNNSDNVFEIDPTLDVSESIRSFNSSAEDSDWDCGEESAEVQGRMSLPPHLNQSLSDLQFKQSLMQRIQEWSNFAEEYNKSRSPTPHCSPVRFVRRSRSLDRHLGDPSMLATDSEIATSKPIEIEPVTEKNLETLEYELHGIQGEFESITSKLHELIEQGTSKPGSPSKLHLSSSMLGLSSLPSPSTHTTTQCSDCVTRSEGTPRPIENKHLMVRKMRTRWEKVPSSGCSESGRSSRASSVEYVWDMADYTAHNSTADRSRMDGVSLSSSPHRSSPRPGSADISHPHEAVDLVKNISLPVNIAEYAQAEWRGGTAKAAAILEGYGQIPQLLGHERLCIVRGDNYCALRSTLFQVLVDGLRVTQNWPGIIGIMDSLHCLFDDASIQLSSWTFANRLPGHCKDKLASISKCALSLYATIEEVSNLATREQREKRVINLFNTNPTFNTELMEGLKVMMLLEAVSLHQKIRDEEEVPIFSHLLFARESSETLSDLLKNHLNPIGDSGGLEQIELCLLGLALGVRIRVLRLSQCGQQDFDCVFPEDVSTHWPVISMIAEDDRHYNASLP